jgi:hypothetical protein
VIQTNANGSQLLYQQTQGVPVNPGLLSSGSSGFLLPLMLIGGIGLVVALAAGSKKA